jgi:hypothetical protein
MEGRGRGRRGRERKDMEGEGIRYQSLLSTASMLIT